MKRVRLVMREVPDPRGGPSTHAMYLGKAMVAGYKRNVTRPGYILVAPDAWLRAAGFAYREFATEQAARTQVIEEAVQVIDYLGLRSVVVDPRGDNPTADFPNVTPAKSRRKIDV